jgi:predicted RNA-binding Zn ribbon-like protein
MSEIEHVGNALCLDFVNSVNARPAPSDDWLATPDSSAIWARSVGVALSSLPDESTLAAARELRESLYRIFSAVARAEEPPGRDLDALADGYARTTAHSRLGREHDAYVWIAPGPRTLATLLGEVSSSGVDLLTRGPLDRIGECPSCRWLFVDTSRNARRRWCSMATCGSRDKARRYYATHAIGSATA